MDIHILAVRSTTCMFSRPKHTSFDGVVMPLLPCVDSAQAVNQGIEGLIPPRGFIFIFIFFISFTWKKWRGRECLFCW